MSQSAAAAEPPLTAEECHALCYSALSADDSSALAAALARTPPAFDLNAPTVEGLPLLHHAARQPRPHALAFLLHSLPPGQLDVNAKATDGSNALAAACEDNCVAAAVTLLLKSDVHCIDAGNQDNEGNTALHQAIRFAWVEAVEALAPAVADGRLDPNVRNSEGTTPLHLLCAMSSGRRRQCGDRLFAAVLQLGTSKLNFAVADMKGQTPLHCAASASNSKFLERILGLKDATVDLTAKNNVGRTAFHCAAAKGSLHMAEVLLRRAPGAFDVNAADHNGATALHVAAADGRRYVVDVLLEHLDLVDVACTDKKGRNALMWACSKGHISMALSILTKAGDHIDLCQASCNGSTALHLACATAMDRAVKALLERGADVTALDRHGRPPFFSALSWTTTAALFFKHCPPELLAKSDQRQCTPLHHAAALGRATVVEQVLQLVDAGLVDANARDESGGTALHCSVRKSAQVWPLLLPRMSEEAITAQDCRGMTALHLAVQKADASARLLLPYFTADARALRSALGKTAIEIAQETCPRMVDLLQGSLTKAAQ
eukprot:CAMPEP_0114609090 /NCGR_PEP_ID=MMETSP0168-20121206/2911_1 /TAXON_ID=95228 ORGANISM="Vannella sp., Strain DIVA3 517/6/12" /NCGR_SAMPLE_ID=MMETSP0168 /ASSEMBLY_ACC=CAM_ASM_000044 /LENGTH=548 /DNA_ID=CAMNT_0001820001 /DNA_START=38 /DNA_END=1684 /DNA_ORIENTATION=+